MRVCACMCVCVCVCMYVHAEREGGREGGKERESVQKYIYIILHLQRYKCHVHTESHLTCNMHNK